MWMVHGCQHKLAVCGRQVSCFAMLMFCFSLEEFMDSQPAAFRNKLQRVGYQDDTYFVGLPTLYNTIGMIYILFSLSAAIN